MTRAALRVITTCTSRKLAENVGPALAALPGLASDVGSVPAERLYTGEQHRRLMAGVSELRTKRRVDVWVISASAGLVPGDRELAPYDRSFAGLPRERVRAIAERLRVAEDLRDLVSTPCALSLLLAGNDYFDAARLDEPIDWVSPTIALTSPSRAAHLPEHPNLQTVAVGQDLARRWSLPLTLLKGELVGRMLSALASGEYRLAEFVSGGAALDVVHRSSPQRIAC
jgi:hypothetical protein